MPSLKKPVAHRWWYNSFRQRSHPWSFEFLKATDEFCNPTVYLGFPVVGAWVIRYKPGPIRTEACDKCKSEFGPWCDRCQGCHDGPRCHPMPCWDDDGHQTAEWGQCPLCGGGYCMDCESDPKQTCPLKEKP